MNSLISSITSLAYPLSATEDTAWIILDTLNLAEPTSKFKSDYA